MRSIRRASLLLVVGAVIPSVVSSQPSKLSDKSVLWYRQPAPIWDHALPVGNGRLGAMVFGGANEGLNNGDLQDAEKNRALMNGSHTSGADEHIQLNESSLWQGTRSNRLNPKAKEAFPKIRQLLLQSKGTDGAKLAEAEKLAQENMIGVPSGMPGYSTLGDLYLRSTSKSPITGYRRELDLRTGVVRITYSMGGVRFKREIFASIPQQVIVMRLSADKPGAISFRASMDRPADFSVHTRNQNTIVLRESSAHIGEIHFAGEAQFLASGGSTHAEGLEVIVSDADAVTVLIAAATDFKGGPFVGGQPETHCEQVLRDAANLSASELLAAQEKIYQPLFKSMSLELGNDFSEAQSLPTDERIKRVSDGVDDLPLQQLYFQFARYLLIASSRPNGLPANLQGIWAAGIDNPWGSKYTINVNTEMNYWLAEPAGLSDSTMSLVNLLDMVRNPATGTGTQVAKTYYGARGFVIHHNIDLWGDAEPIDGYQYGIWPMGGAWLALQGWEHYAFTQDQSFLRSRAWPILHDAAQFFLDYLVDDGQGHLVTGPSLSPENQYVLPDGTSHSLTMAPTMDIEIVRELFTRTLDSGHLLQQDAAFLKQIEEARAKLPPLSVGRFGQLQEWQQDYEESAPGHRHISHLWALFPGTQISPADTPELAKAARVSLERRLANGGGQTGWSRAWVVNYWNHLHEGKQAYDSLQVMFRQSTFPNLMDTHPPGVFQIDGNLGAANGMLEALIQSRWQPEFSEIELLPALPAQWASGSLEGVRVRGGASVDMQWSNCRVTFMKIHAMSDGKIRLIVPVGQVISKITSSTNPHPLSVKDNLLAIHKGDSYVITLR